MGERIVISTISFNQIDMFLKTVMEIYVLQFIIFYEQSIM